MIWLKNFRKGHKLSQKQMAKTLGISKSYYEKIEQGSKCPSTNFIRRFLKAFPETDVNVFF